jgi:uncharacterized protein YdeI (YjbR/CyaY-like superfamily)
VPDLHPDDNWPIVPFPTAADFEAYLEEHHDGPTGLWLKFAKKHSGIATITFAEATEVALCFGYIDSKMHRIDDDWHMLRYTPRGPKSNWSERNKELAAQLIEEGRMRPSGMAAIDAAKADGRWD